MGKEFLEVLSANNRAKIKAIDLERKKVQRPSSREAERRR